MAADEKRAHDVEHIEAASPNSKFREGSGEEAEGRSPPVDLTPEQEKALWRKIDRRLLPMLSVMYLMSFLDRGESTPRSQAILSLTSHVGNIGMPF